jgi:hypothetical protein
MPPLATLPPLPPLPTADPPPPLVPVEPAAELPEPVSVLTPPHAPGAHASER